MQERLAGVAELFVPLKPSINGAVDMNKRPKLGSAIGDLNVANWVFPMRKLTGRKAASPEPSIKGRWSRSAHSILCWRSNSNSARYNAGIPLGMAFGVFIHRSDSIYDDTPAERYQFPRQYLGRAQATVGDWIIYYEPRKVVGTRGYFAVAKVERIIPDPSASDMYLAIIEPGTYLDFANPIPFADDNGVVVEMGVLNDAGRISGRAQSAVRELSTTDFARIIGAGLAENDVLLPRIGEDRPANTVHEDRTPFIFDETRERVAMLVSRVMRDRVFRRVVLRAYDERCAVTGLKLINGGGRAEVEAVHIRPVEANGPDIVSNGLALSGTAHWMFDRGLIGVDDDMTILVSRQVNDPESIHTLINRSGRILLPPRKADRPHPQFVGWHREHCFKH